MKIKETKHLFYQKYPYKARLKNLDWINISLDRSRYRFSRSQIKLKDLNTIEKLEQFLRDRKDDIKVRSEIGMSIFFAKKELLKELQSISPDMVEEFYEPKNQDALELMLSAIKVEVREHLIHDCRYKVFLGNDFRGVGEKFVAFVRNNPDKFNISSMLLNQLESMKKSYWVATPYFYVKDSQTLLLTQMWLGNLVKKTVKIVTYDELAKEKIDHEQHQSY